MIYRTLTQGEEGEDPLQHGGRLEPPPQGHFNRSKVDLHGRASEREPSRDTHRSEGSIQKTALTAMGSKSVFTLLLLLLLFSTHLI